MVCVTVRVGAPRFAFNVLVRVLMVFFVFAPFKLVKPTTDRALGLESFVVAVVAPVSSGFSNKCLRSDEELWISRTSAGDNGPVDVIVPVDPVNLVVVFCFAFCPDPVAVEVESEVVVVGVDMERLECSHTSDSFACWLYTNLSLR